MTTHPDANVVVTPDVTCRECNETMDDVSGEFRTYQCSTCEHTVKVNGEYDVEVVSQ